jgi:diguanylate cyclase (GGDEF)-like protein/PAS domain S-box-containing protein
VSVLLVALLPAASLGHGLGYLLVAGGAAVGAARGYRRLFRARRRPWSAVVAGLGLVVLADAARIVGRLAGTDLPFEHPVHLLCSVGVVAIGLGVSAMVREGSRPDRGALIDALLVTTSAGLVSGVLLLRPLGAELASDAAGAVQLVAYSGAHLFLLVATTRFALTAPRGSPAGRRLIAGALTLPLAATALGVLITADGTAPRGALDLAWLAAYLLLATSVRHPTAAELTAPITTRDASGPGRLVLITLVLMLLPGLQLALARSRTEMLVAAATALLLALVTARIGLLLREARRTRGQEVILERERGRRRLSALLQHATDVVVVIDARGQVRHATASAEQLLGEDPTGWSTRQLVQRFHPTDREEVGRRVEHGLAGAGPQAVRPHARLLDRAGDQRHVELVVADLRDDPDVQGTVLTLRDITERVELERRLRRLAFHDALTGLCNRELFQDRLVQALRRSERGGQRVAVLLCDLDDFKNVNDTRGHATGDALLRHVADRLLGAARTSDTVARLGGDEFAIICEGLERTRDAIEVARRVLHATSEPVVVGDRELTVGISVGIAVDDGHRSAEELLRDADIALYDAKDDGKQRWALHEESMTVRAQQRLQLEVDLARAVSEGRIETAYQPIVTLDEQRIVGVEVLARWEHPDHGWVPPGDFIAIAERSGLIVELGDAILDDALRTLRGWLDQRPGLVLRMGVNVSARQMRDPGLPGRVARKLEALDLDPSLLIMELTESVMLDEADLAIEVMHELRRLGVSFAVDDFGTGYSSLAYLRRLPVSIVKTDRAFVNSLGIEEGADQLVRAIIEMARSMHLDVVAEGVETLVQHDVLRELGCIYGQGYRFAHPVAANVLGPRLLAPDALVVTRSADTVAVVGDQGLATTMESWPVRHLGSG